MSYIAMHWSDKGWEDQAGVLAWISQQAGPDQWRVAQCLELDDPPPPLIPIGTQVFVATMKGVLKGTVRSTVVTTNADGQKVVYRYSYGANDNGDAYPQYVFTDPMEAFKVMEEMQK